jgi:hypothetical protein
MTSEIIVALILLGAIALGIYIYYLKNKLNVLESTPNNDARIIASEILIDSKQKDALNNAKDHVNKVSPDDLLAELHSELHKRSGG